MKSLPGRWLLSACAICIAASAHSESYIREQWWPSRWGSDDQRGALNRLTPAKVLEAVALIKSGRIYDLGHVFEEDMPLFDLTPGARKFTLTIPGSPSWGPLGENRLAWNEEYISGHLGQDGTQMDSLAHMATVRGKPGNLDELRYYNGFSHAEIGGGRGFSKLGAEHITPVFTRGILIDVAGLKGRMLERSEEISVADLVAALQRQGMSGNSIRPGDALFYHTGWGSLWKTDNRKFNSGTPGLSIEAGDWVVKKEVVLVGTDNWAVEAIPNPDPKWFAPNHQKFLIENGIYIIENMVFGELLEAGVYEFAFALSPLPLKGATGSPVRPFAIN
ncbi:MAG: cyclase family protein [Gammaproteobacteria bacterium]